ncbi:MAG: DUF1566 domain-containing protein [Polaromonas sp.]
MAGIAASVGQPDPDTGKPAANVQTSARPRFAALKIGERSEHGGGIYAGVSRGLDGEADGHLFLLDDKPDDKLDWKAAVAWAESLGNGARLPTRFESALLYANLQDQLDTEAWHWTGTQYSDSSAWGQYFNDGYQGNLTKSYEARARAVRRLVL